MPNTKSTLKWLAVVTALLLTVPAGAQRPFNTDILEDTFGYNKSSKRTVALEDIQQGCAQRDCIPSIDKPKYVGVKDAAHVTDEELVLAIAWKGYHRAWPARILDQHEIVNDFIAGTPIAITWCPLCGSAVGVIRELDGRITEFGVSGLLYNSDLVFYDRLTETLWDQVEAKAIVGPLAGRELELVPVTMTSWDRWKNAHPDTVVLSADTGFLKDYSIDPYEKYRGSRRLMFPVSRKSNAIHPKTVVFGFEFADYKVAFTESFVQSSEGVRHEVAGEYYDLSLGDDGSVVMTDVNSGETYAPIRLYWFAWFTFHPDSELVTGDER